MTNFYINPYGQASIDYQKLNNATNAMFTQMNGMFGNPLVQYQMPNFGSQWFNQIVNSIDTSSVNNSNANLFNGFNVAPNINYDELAKKFLEETQAKMNIPTTNGTSFGTTAKPDELTEDYKKIVDELAEYGVPSTGSKAKDEAILKEIKNQKAAEKLQGGDLSSIINRATNRWGTDDEALSGAISQVSADNVTSLLDNWDKNYKAQTGKSLVEMVADDTSGEDREAYMNTLANALAEKMIASGLENEAAEFKNKVSAILSKKVKAFSDNSKKWWLAGGKIAATVGLFKNWSNSGNLISDKDQIAQLNEAFESARAALAAKDSKNVSDVQAKNEKTFAPKEKTEAEKRQDEINKREEEINKRKEDLNYQKRLQDLEKQEKELGIA